MIAEKHDGGEILIEFDVKAGDLEPCLPKWHDAPYHLILQNKRAIDDAGYTITRRYLRIRMAPLLHDGLAAFHRIWW